jgi:hypothetical protein
MESIHNSRRFFKIAKTNFRQPAGVLIVVQHKGIRHVQDNDEYRCSFWPKQAPHHRDRRCRPGVHRRCTFYRFGPPSLLACGSVRATPEVVLAAPQCDPTPQRVWVEPVYRTVTDRVWIEPVTTVQVQRFDVPAQYGVRDVVFRDYYGHARIRREQVLISPTHCEERSVPVVVCPGHFEEQTHQVLVCDGHWETQVDQPVTVVERPHARLEIPLPF